MMHCPCRRKTHAEVKALFRQIEELGDRANTRRKNEEQ